MASLLEALHEFVQQHHLAAGHYQAVHSIQIVLAPPVVLLSTLKQKRVVARLLQLCDDVQQRHLPPLAPLYIQGKLFNKLKYIVQD